MAGLGVDTVRSMFPKTSWANIDRNYEDIATAFDQKIAAIEADNKHGQIFTADEKKQLALFMYATVRAENASFTAKSESMNPTNSFAFNEAVPQYDQKGRLTRVRFVPELIEPTSGHSLLGQPFGLYETGTRQKNLGNHYGDGEKYKGRGYVQLTGRDNYRNYSKVVPGLENNPALADDKRNAAKILVAYILDHGHRHLILKSLAEGNLSAARNVVNGKPKRGHQPNGLNAFALAYNKGQDHLAKRAASPAK